LFFLILFAIIISSSSSLPLSLSPLSHQNHHVHHHYYHYHHHYHHHYYCHHHHYYHNHHYYHHHCVFLGDIADTLLNNLLDLKLVFSRIDSTKLCSLLTPSLVKEVDLIVKREGILGNMLIQEFAYIMTYCSIL
jgi:hypothetical protein